MTVQVGVGFVVSPVLHMKPSPMLVGFAETLALSSLEMERTVARELAENPALERIEDPVCRFCGGHAPNCPLCRPALREPASRAARKADHLDPTSLLVDEESPRDRLLRDVLTLLPSKDRNLAELVIGSLSERGFLEESAATLARRAGVAEERICRVVTALRTIGPPGIAASDVRESLLLQLDSRTGTSRARRGSEEESWSVLARRIITGHLEELGQGRFSAIAQALEVGVSDVRGARAFIQRALTPSPADCIVAESWARPRRAPALPDLVITERSGRPGHYAVELAEAARCAVRVDPVWRATAGAATASAATAGAVTAGAGDCLVGAMVRRADAFLVRLEGRWEAIRLIGAYLAERQRGFIQEGPASMTSLTRAQVARALRLSESTVSRAVAGKFALMPQGNVVPLADFFDCSLRVRMELQTIIAAEKRPLSDSELAQQLRRRGYDVARRTVAKYRDRLGILSAALR